ncbi:MAG: 2-C-methyl-D-erythritol 4-phosphate cytidylyltransferase [Defluviitaleaceae bacterium]|nr:2-C-methyl-D-erythritol 4-phosphate cytidylyltransferase [Defluviitaleaceae bacterium]
MKVKVVIPASGAGVRLGGDIPKQFLEIDGEPVLKRTLAVFNALEITEEIAVAVPTKYLHTVESYGFSKLRHIVPGGENRAESVFAALNCFAKVCPASINPGQIILIHDGIRPFVSHEIITNVAAAAAKYGAAVACTRVTDTIKQADSHGKIKHTPPRETLWQAQTPQGFTYEIIRRAYETAAAENRLSQATDDSALAEALGIGVQIVESSPANIKITTQTDLKIAEAMLK